jgi:ankyrin repeat protein
VANIFHNNLEEVRIALEAGISPDETNREGASPLHIAALHGDIARATLLIESGATEIISAKGHSPLSVAVREGHLPVVAALLEAGHNPLHQNPHTGDTMLHYLFDGYPNHADVHVQMYDQLKEAGLTPDSLPTWGPEGGVLKAAVERWRHTTHEEAVITLTVNLIADGWVTEKEREDRELYTLISFTDTKLTAYMIDSGSSPHLLTKAELERMNIQKVVPDIAREKQSEAIQLVLSFQPQDTRLLEYALLDQIQDVDHLLSTKSPDGLKELAAVCAPSGMNALMALSASGGLDPQSEAMQNLIKASDINHADRFGKTALHYAAEYGHDRSATMLLAAGAKNDIADNHGNTPGMLKLFADHPQLG